MRRSLFEQIPEEPLRSPRIRPNMAARIARYCYKNSIVTLLFWAIISIACVSYVVHFVKPAQQAHLSFSQSTKAANDLQNLQQNFANIYALSKVNLSSQNPENLISARRFLQSKLEERTDLFLSVISPGNGGFYDTHGILFLPDDIVKASVENALALQPLFAAIAEQPNTASLATLINEVAASIAQGRNPQGLDALFSEATFATTALMKKTERPVDWTTVAGINAVGNPKAAQLITVPQLGKVDAATAFLNQTILETEQQRWTGEEEVTFKLEQGAAPTAPMGNPAVSHFGPMVAFAIVLSLAALFVTLGNAGLGSMVVLPAIVTMAFCWALVNALLPNYAKDLWFAPLVASMGALLLAMRMSFAVLESFAVARVRSSAIMLAAQQQTSQLLWILCATILPIASWWVLGDMNWFKFSIIFFLCYISAFLCCLSLVPACAAMVKGPLRWTAVEWLLPLQDQLFTGQLWRFLQKGFAALILLVALFGVLQVPRFLTTNAQHSANLEKPVYVLANSEAEVGNILENLKQVPEALSVQWLGMFLPQAIAAKQEILKSLKGKFSPISPQQAQDPDTIREQISTLLDSLQNIANAKETSPSLAKLAHDFRRSLEVLSSTGSDEEIVQFEKRMFGAFNVLPEKAELLASLKVPAYADIDKPLRQFFLSDSGVFRLAVEPVANVKPSMLAAKLAARGFATAQIDLAENAAAAGFLNKCYLVILAMLCISIFLMAVYLRNAWAICVAALVIVMSLLISIALATFQNQFLTIQFLILISTQLSIVAVYCVTHLYNSSPRNDHLHTALQTVERWLVPVILLMVAAASKLAKSELETTFLTMLAVSMFTVAASVEFLGRPLTKGKSDTDLRFDQQTAILNP